MDEEYFEIFQSLVRCIHRHLHLIAKVRNSMSIFSEVSYDKFFWNFQQKNFRPGGIELSTFECKVRHLHMSFFNLQEIIKRQFLGWVR